MLNERFPIYQVDAFTAQLFSGNPAAVVFLDHWADEQWMQAVAAENNLAETAFVVEAGEDFEIRWFTPKVEVDLCGHATLASAYVLFKVRDYPHPVIRFHSSRSGMLQVTMEGERLFLDFPTDHLTRLESMDGQLNACIGVTALAIYKGKTDYLVQVADEATVRTLRPVLGEIAKLDARGLIVTAPGKDVDFVSRFFAPQSGIDEDPVTGSAHTSLIPFWSGILNKEEMTALQLSSRGGKLFCRNAGDRCFIGGEARLFFSGHIELS